MKRFACGWFCRCACLLLIALLQAPFLMGGPLADKAAAFDQVIEERHCPLGLVLNLRPASQDAPLQVSGGGDSTIWTGCYLAAQGFRYRVTKDEQALRNIRKSLQALVDLHAMSGCPGFLGRTFGPPEWFGGRPDMRPGVGSYSHFLYRPDTSRDQYTGLFLGLGVTWPLLEEGKLKDDVRAMVQAIGRNLMTNNLALQVDLGDVRFQPFNLDPTYCYQDRLTPEEWARVDDFPANVLARVIPYDQRLADALATFRPPPVRGGEALRALLMFQIAAAVTADPDIRAFLQNELLGRRNFLKVITEAGMMLSDLWYGRAEKVLERTAGELWEALFDVSLRAGLTLDALPLVPIRIMQALLPPLARWEGIFLWRKVSRMLATLRTPGGMKVLARPVPFLQAIEAQYGQFLKPRQRARLARHITWLETAAASSLDAAADAMRSYVGKNLTFLALLGLLETQPPPRVRDAARNLLERAWVPISDEANALYTYIRAAYGKTPVPYARMAEARQALQRYPLDQTERRFDHRNDPGIKLLPWPDRFGRVGGLAADPIPVSARAPHIFIWQENPRAVVTGSDSGNAIAPVGYLLAYWLGRHHGFLTPED